MFTFDDIQSSPISITPIFGGTDHIYLTKVEYTSPAEKTPRTELHFERRVPGAKVERSMITLNDWTLRPKIYENQDKDEKTRLFNIIATYRPDLTDEQLRNELNGSPTWKALWDKVVSLMPSDYPQLATTWFFRYRKNSDILEIPTYNSVVKLGNGKSFKMNNQYDFMTPQVRESNPVPTPALSLQTSTVDETELF